VTAAVDLKGIHKHFGAVRAVDGIDLHLELGEIAALLGPNGAGETTTIDVILGLGRPDSGTVSVLGMSPAAAIGRGLISAVMQTGGLLKDLTVSETVRLTSTLFANARPVGEVLERAGIAGIGDRLVGKCSGGQQQRLRFALALLPDPAMMQIIGPVLGVFALFGGLFVPVSLLPSTMQDLAPYMPTYGVAAIARYPLLGGAFDVTWVLGALLWTAAFAAGATILFRRDTRRT
jgi:ABC-type branched-subunit amino acid transport system ATPase component